MIHRLILFVVILAAGFAFEAYELQTFDIQKPWNEALASISQRAITLFHGSVTRNSNVLSDPQSHKAVSVLSGCNGLEVTWMLIVAVLVYPSCIKAKLVGVVLGFLGIQGLNVFRIISLYYLNVWRPEYFQFAHLYLWQSLIMLDVMVLLLIWLRWQKGVCKRP
jgi:exosortase H (IPTLxxWG-CTERM-specific)